MIGSYIVGATIVREDYELYQERYPLIEQIADLGADLETLDGSQAELVLKGVHNNLGLLKQQVANN